MFVHPLFSVRSGTLASSLAIALSAAIHSQSNVLVVDWGGGGQFTEIQAAVDAAQPGDTILVRPRTVGTYWDVLVTGKSLTIVGDSQTGFVNVAHVRVLDLDEDQSVVFARLRARTLTLSGNDGRVSLVGCRSIGYGGVDPHPPGMIVESSDGLVALADCSFLGGAGSDEDGWGDVGSGQPGLHVRDSIAIAFDVAIEGGVGGMGLSENGGTGGTGAIVERASALTALLTLNTSIKGGRGGASNDCFGSVSGDGGIGLEILPTGMATSIDSVLTGGSAGTTPGFCFLGSPGAPLVNAGYFNDHPFDEPPPAHLQLRAPGVAREGETIALSFQGAPGTEVYLIEGTARREARLAWGGILLVRPARAVRSEPSVPLGTIQPDGTLSVSYALPQVPSGATNLWFQAYTGGPGRTIGSFAVVTVLDSIY